MEAGYGATVPRFFFIIGEIYILSIKATAVKSNRYLFPALVALLIISSIGCSRRGPNEIVIWNQMRPTGREILRELTTEFEQTYNAQLAKDGYFTGENDSVRVSQIYYETEELRSNYQISALGGSGPDIIFGPADAIGPFHVMGIIKPMEDLFSDEYLDKFIDQAKTSLGGHLYQIGDRVGNHLTLVYNKDIIDSPPTTTNELFAMSDEYTIDENGDGLYDQYTLVFNFIEPFFFVPFLGGYGGWVMNDRFEPTLNTDAAINAYKFIVELRDRNVIPREADYDIANTLFKSGKSAMIINGPWSWGGYINSGMNIGLARIPKVSDTGKWSTPMYSPLGYSLNVNLTGERLDHVKALLKKLLSPESELRFTKRMNTIPSRKEALESSIVSENPIVSASRDQLEVSRPMPVVPEMRAIWDAMRPAWQSILNGSLTPREAAEKMQHNAEQKIREMTE